jgi:hypothetical protein
MADPDAVTTSFPQPPRPGTRRRQIQNYGEVVAPPEPGARPVSTSTSTYANYGRPATEPEANPRAPRLAHLIPPPSPADAPREAIMALQNWQGVVLEVRADSFVARVVDAAGEHPDEEVELPREDLSPFEIDLLEEGAIFYWTIGYRQRLPRGQRERISRIRLRRLPAWSRSELAAARARAEALGRDLGWS